MSFFSRPQTYFIFPSDLLMSDLVLDDRLKWKISASLHHEAGLNTQHLLKDKWSTVTEHLRITSFNLETLHNQYKKRHIGISRKWFSYCTHLGPCAVIQEETRSKLCKRRSWQTTSQRPPPKLFKPARKSRHGCLYIYIKKIWKKI